MAATAHEAVPLVEVGEPLMGSAQRPIDQLESPMMRR